MAAAAAVELSTSCASSTHTRHQCSRVSGVGSTLYLWMTQHDENSSSGVVCGPSATVRCCGRMGARQDEPEYTGHPSSHTERERERASSIRLDFHDRERRTQC